MAYKDAKIKTLVEQIQRKEILIPSIQRNFVWPVDKVVKLFDSLLNEYPIGTFLFWQVDKNKAEGVVFNDFISKYDERKTAINRGSSVALEEDRTYLGVLDGQQRITSIFLGIAGVYEMHVKGLAWAEDSSYEAKKLCIDLFEFEANNPKSENHQYAIDFIAVDSQNKIIKDFNGNYHYWLPFGIVLEREDLDKLAFELQAAFMKQTGLQINPDNFFILYSTLGQIKKVFTDSECISYYPADDDLWDVVEMFVRVNSGGQALKASDLMLSIASASQHKDIQLMIHDAAIEISKATVNQDKSFNADKDLIIRAGLMFSDAKNLSLKNKKNWELSAIDKIMAVWDETKKYLIEAVKYVEAIGFDPSSLTSSNLILPVAYYFYTNGIDKAKSYATSTKKEARADRKIITQWLLRAMIKGLFSWGTPQTLLNIRDNIKTAKDEKKTYFPLDKLMDPNGKKSLRITDDDIEEMIRYKYKDGRTYPLLGAISECDPYNFVYQRDHIWPQDMFVNRRDLKAALKELGLEDKTDAYYSAFDQLRNIQLLRDTENNEKGAQNFNDWIELNYGEDESLKNYCKRCVIPYKKDLFTFDHFLEFLNEREELLASAIKAEFNDNVTEKILEAEGII